MCTLTVAVLKILRLAILIVIATSWVVWSQEGIILTLQKEGAAAIYFSQNTATAYIMDGGPKTALSNPVVGGKPVLQALLDGGYKHLVISCSHPHDDHAAGIKELILHDQNLDKFTSVRFVDSGYPGADALYSAFLAAHPNYPRENTSRGSAENNNAFSKLSKPEDGATVNNFVYKPRPGAAPHGHTIISHISLILHCYEMRLRC